MSTVWTCKPIVWENVMCVNIKLHFNIFHQNYIIVFLWQSSSKHHWLLQPLMNWFIIMILHKPLAKLMLLFSQSSINLHYWYESRSKNVCLGKEHLLWHLNDYYRHNMTASYINKLNGIVGKHRQLYTRTDLLYHIPPMSAVVYKGYRWPVLMNSQFQNILSLRWNLS